MGLRVVKIFFNVSESIIAREYLRDKSLFATIQDENHIQTNYYYSQALGNVKLQVVEKEFETALDHLNNIDSEYAEQEGNKCSNCGSERTVRMYKYSLWQIPILICFIIPLFPLMVLPKYFSHLKCCSCKAKTYLANDEDDDFNPVDVQI